jgi:hypothetical protein
MLNKEEEIPEIDQLFNELGRIEYELIYYSQMVENHNKNKSRIMKTIDETLYSGSLKEEKNIENETDLG